jgi:hypothetical protein
MQTASSMVSSGAPSNSIVTPAMGAQGSMVGQQPNMANPMAANYQQCWFTSPIKQSIKRI